jgi:DNA replication and repair protein RecF
MLLQQLDLFNFRNFSRFTLQLAPGFNLICGANGSGKSSILEAVHIMGLGRSFRTQQLQQAIQQQAERYAIHAQIQKDGSHWQLGTEKAAHGKALYKADNKPSTMANLAQLLPLQAITAESQQLLQGSSESRRRFFDWLMFHVEPSFLPNWQQYQNLLLQRNALLKHPPSSRQTLETMLKAWDCDFIKTSTTIQQLRNHIWPLLLAQIQALANSWLPQHALMFEYYAGWPCDAATGEASATSLALALAERLPVDLYRGYSSFGAHRFDIQISWEGQPAKAMLSRGQQKVLVYLLMLARNMLLQQQYQKSSIFLLDDLSAELDLEASTRLINGLAGLNTQVLLTQIQATTATPLFQDYEYHMQQL